VLEQSERRAPPRPEAGDEDIRVEDDALHHMVL
jgi:hypothetical protein